MVKTESTMLPLGTQLPTFTLKDTVTGDFISSQSVVGKKVVIGFICNHCPFVVHILAKLVEVCTGFQEQGIHVIMVSSNNPDAYPQDSPEKMTEHAKSSLFTFPYCFDETQSVALSFQAVCTPEFYLFDNSHRLVYRGQFDGSLPNNNIPVTGADLKAAVDLSHDGKIVEVQKASIGCGIKWK